jgi:hypothetical protein
MTEYIITEEQLEQISERCVHLEFKDCFKCPYYRTHKDCPTDMKELKSKVRSRPYQNQREKEAHEHGWFTDWEMKEAELKGYNKGNADGMAYGRKSEREKVMDEFLHRSREESTLDDDTDCPYHRCVLCEIREELRGEQ